LTFPFDGRSFPHTQIHCYINPFLHVIHYVAPTCYAALIKQEA
jgi:hypothetical protein